MYELIAMDIDGTLMGDDYKLSKKVLEYINVLQTRGVHVALSTGRQFPAIKWFVDNLSLKGCHIVSGGALVYDLDQKETVCSYPLPRDAIITILRYCEFNNLYAIVSCGLDSFGVGKPFEINKLKERYIPIPNKIQIDNLNINICYGITVMGIRNSKMLNALIELCNNFHEVTQLSSSAVGFMDILGTSVTKGRALKVIAKRLHIPQDKIFAIGDSDADVSMLEASGFGVAVANATDKLKIVANYVSNKNSQEGTIEAIERYII
jgi:Cof subfamily protein (haloacid dehalogenase superfamily)